MVTDRAKGVKTLCLGLRLGLVALTYIIWLYICLPLAIGDRTAFNAHLLYLEFLLIGVVLSPLSRGSQSIERSKWTDSNRSSLRQTVGGFLSVLLVVFFVKDDAVSRSFLLSYVPWLYLTLLISNYWLPPWVARLAFPSSREERVVLAGSVEKARRLQPWLERKSGLGFRTVGLLSTSGVVEEGSPFPILGTLENVAEVLARSSITQLIVLDPSLGGSWLRQLTHTCENAAVRMVALNDLDEQFSHAITMFEDDGVRFIGLREEPLENPANRALKRILDLLVALPVVLLLLPPVTLLVWLLHRWQSPGPVFYQQVRSGMMGRPFRMLKFRTMHVHQGDVAKQATQTDPRIFPAGRWLRKLSIDELPQFVNVLYGNMSVVGPRPHLRQHDDAFSRVMGRYLIRRFILPGITGWAQVSGYRGEIHSDEDVQRRVNADLHYLENWSFSLDLLIIAKTIWHCLVPPKSAY